SIWKFIKYIKEELLIVLGTSSSESVLPRMMAKLENLGVKKSTVGLVIPTGIPSTWTALRSTLRWPPSLSPRRLTHLSTLPTSLPCWGGCCLPPRGQRESLAAA